MKITNLKCAVIADSQVIRIATEEGITGWSQIATGRPTAHVHRRTVCAGGLRVHQSVR